MSILLAAIGLVSAVGGANAGAAEAPVELGTAGSYAVLAGSTVTNTGHSVIGGDLGVSPGTAVTGFPPGILVGGTKHAADAVALQAEIDLKTAFNDAAKRAASATVTSDLGGQTLVPGVYVGATLSLTGTVTLNAQHNPNAVFVFKSASTLITASSSVVAMINGVNPCNVFWEIGSSVTLGTNSTLVGTAMALTAITANTGADITGRLLARTAAVTLDTNAISLPTCSITPPTSTGVTTPTSTGVTTPTSTGVTTPTSTGVTTPTSTGVTTPTSTGVTTPTSTGGATSTAGSTSPGGRTTTGVSQGSTSATTSLSTSRTGNHTGSTVGSGSSGTQHIVNGVTTPTTPLARTGASIVAPTVVGGLALVLGCLLLGFSRRTQLRRH